MCENWNECNFNVDNGNNFEENTAEDYKNQ